MHYYSGECSKSSDVDYLQFKWDLIWIIKLNKLQKPVWSVSEQKLSFLDRKADTDLQFVSFTTICLTGDFRGTVEKMRIRSQSWSPLTLRVWKSFQKNEEKVWKVIYTLNILHGSMHLIVSLTLLVCLSNTLHRKTVQEVPWRKDWTGQQPHLGRAVHHGPMQTAFVCFKYKTTI